MLKPALIVAIFGLVAYFEPCAGHGMLLQPPGRSSRWRTDRSAPTNYDDNQVWCGGLSTQHITHGGKCGMCGDNYGDARPKANELGGRFGQGVITATYPSSGTIKLGANIAVNHRGYMHYDLCNLDEFGGVESEECYQKYRLKFTNGQDKYNVGSTKGMLNTDVVLPKGLTCEHCVIRWTYIVANNCGICENGSGAMGCGPQEWFRSCADVRIK